MTHDEMAARLEALTVNAARVEERLVELEGIVRMHERMKYFRVFYHPDLGSFSTNKEDLSDLDGVYLEHARKVLS
jgi:hypothetical protein